MLLNPSPPVHFPISPAPHPSRYESISSQDIYQKRLVTQLAYLASQHHTSDYNRFKFGDNGASAVYVPLSIQVPSLVKELQSRQAANEQKKSWWLSEIPISPIHHHHISKANPRQPPLTSQTSLNDFPPFLNTVSAPTLVTSPSTDLQQEISAAIASQISLPSAKQVKTSDSHPINISVILPSTLLAIISSHLISAVPPSPVIFHIHPSYTLDKVTSFNGSTNCVSHSRIDHTSVVSSPLTVPSQNGVGDQSKLYTIQSAEETHIRNLRRLSHHQSYGSDQQANLLSTKNDVTDDCSVSRDRNSVSYVSNIDERRSVSTQKRFIRLRPRSDRTAYTPSLPSFKPLLSRSSRHEGKSIISESPLTRDNAQILPPSISPFDSISLPYSASDSFINTGFSGISDGVNLDRMTSFMQIDSSKKLGNLFLSSCPGKKVRLTGPVKGRGAICRDLRQDLNRIKDLGVGCIVCCLDDEELDFLGVSWSNYAEIAKELGLDVLRLPTPEGLAPLTPASLDTHLTSLIESYTLRGIPILSHCRGGVGRAGLVACCWILKLGLCGWKQQEFCRPPAYEGEICPATVHLVERVITAIRRRRSLKAVETYEQVKFLVDYVEYLDTVGLPRAACKYQAAS